MKKFLKLLMVCGFIIRSRTTLKIMRMARLTLFLVLLGAAQVFALDSYSQVTKLTLKFHQAELEQVLDEIEEKSEFFFLYNKDLIDVEQKVDVEVENKMISEILDEILKGKNIQYYVFDRHIVLSNQLGKTGLGNNLDMSQQPAVSGTVTDKAGQTLPGVTVLVKGTTQGTVTNADGNYSITSIPEDATLVFSFVGMITQEVVVGNQTNIDITMEIDAIGIEEVVAVGYGTQRKVNMTGSIASVKTDELQNIPMANLSFWCKCCW